MKTLSKKSLHKAFLPVLKTENSTRLAKPLFATPKTTYTYGLRKEPELFLLRQVAEADMCQAGQISESGILYSIRAWFINQTGRSCRI
jgi:hypothetical protein